MDEEGQFYHLIPCNVILGKSWRHEDPFTQELRENFGQVQSKLQENQYDSLTGGPHQPLDAGPGDNDSIMYVDYSFK